MKILKINLIFLFVLISKTNNQQLKSVPFIIYVKKAAFDAEIITSSNEFQALTCMVNKIDSTLNKTDLVDSMLEYENSYPYIIGLVLRSTRNITNVPVQHRSREVGASGYTMKKLMALWFNGFTAFSILPLRIATITGVTFAVGGFLYGIYTIIKKIVNPAVPMGFSSLMAATVFIGGMLMIMLGLIGEYIGRIYISINNSPQYVIREETDNTPVTIHGMEAAHSNDSGRYLKFCFAKIAPPF